MRRSCSFSFVLLQILGLVTLTSSRPCCGAVGDEHDRWLSAGHGRALLGVERMHQCAWQKDSGCGLGPEYVVRKLTWSNGSSPTAQLLASSLQCATKTSRGACEVAGVCSWEGSFTDGQNGCFVQREYVTQLQQNCTQPRYAGATSQLHQCMARSGSCQCQDEASCKRLLALPDKQLQAQCPSLLGCWLLGLDSASVDVTKLVAVHVRALLPQLDGLRSWQVPLKGGAVAATGRRRLLQPAMTEAMALGDAVAAAAGMATQKGEALAAAVKSAVGQNLPLIQVDFSVLPPGTAATVVRTTDPTGAAALSFMPESGSLNLEAGSLSGGSTTISTPGGSGASWGGEGMVPGDESAAQQPFWQCVATAAAAANAARVWSAAQQASAGGAAFEALSGVAGPLQALDFGVAALDCFRAAVPFSAPVAPMAEAYELSLVQLIRVMTSERDLFRQWARSRADPAGVVHTILNSILPDAVIKLQGVYNSSAGYTHDVVLQTQAILTDMQWYAREAEYVVLDEPGLAAPAVEAQMGYSARMLLRTLQWLLGVQFGGPGAVAPPAPLPTPAGVALSSGLDALAAAYLPPLGAAPSVAGWLQARSMLGDAVNAAAAGVLAAPGPLNETAQARLALEALGSAHLVDLWARRLGAARASAAPAARTAALEDRSVERSWQCLVVQEVRVVRGVVALADALGAGAAGAATVAGYGWYDSMLSGLDKFLACAAETVNPTLVQGGVDAQRLAAAGTLANSTRLCYAAPGGAGEALRREACALLDVGSERLLQQALNAQQGSSLYQGATAALRLQWHCANLAVEGGACAAQAGCAQGMLPAGSGGGGKAGARLVCEASNTQLADSMQLVWNETLSQAATSPECASFLAMPACSSIMDEAMCGAFPSCTWWPGGARTLVLMSEDRSSALAPVQRASNATRQGDCMISWSAASNKLAEPTSNVLMMHAKQCGDQASQRTCQALQLDMVDDSEAAHSAVSSTRIWAPLLAVAVVLIMALVAVLLYMRRKRSVAREEAEAAAMLTRRARKRKGDKKRTWKSKIKRSVPNAGEPGDLMRDSFSDYLSFAPPVAYSDAPDEGMSTIGVGVNGARSVNGGSSSFSFMDNPLNALHEEIGARLRIIVPDLGLGLGLGANPLLQGSGSGARAAADAGLPVFTPGATESPRLASANGGAHRSLARVSSQSSISSSNGDGTSMGAHLSRLLRQRRAGGPPSEGAGGFSCHDSVRTFGEASSSGGSGAATPALSLSRDSWNSTDLLVSTHPPPHPPGTHPAHDLL